MSFRNWAIIIGLGIIWGSSFLFNAILNDELGAFWVSAGRVGIGALGSWAFLLVMRIKLPKLSMIYVHFLILGTLSYAVPFAIFPVAQHSLPAGAAAIINAITPIMTVIVSHFWPGGEKATFKKSLGVFAGFIGVAILASPALTHGVSAEIWAVGLCVSATICYAIALNYTRTFNHIDPTVLAACALTGAALSAATAALMVHGAPPSLSLGGWGALFGIGLLATTLAFQVMYRMLPIVGPTNFSATTFIAPVSAIFLGTFILGETLEMVHFVGMFAIFVGLLLIDGRLFKGWKKAAQSPKT